MLNTSFFLASQPSCLNIQSNLPSVCFHYSFVYKLLYNSAMISVVCCFLQSSVILLLGENVVSITLLMPIHGRTLCSSPPSLAFLSLQVNIYFETFLVWLFTQFVLFIGVLHLQIHYDRVGKDGFSRYREITLLFLPDLDNCLPSLDAWRSQWISRREARVEREQEAMLKTEKVCDLCISMRNQFVCFLLM